MFGGLVMLFSGQFAHEDLPAVSLPR